MSKVNIPKTTPESETLQKTVIEALNNTNFFDTWKKEDARKALKSLRENRCVKSLEYIIQVASEGNILDNFSKEVFNTATRYLSELS